MPMLPGALNRQSLPQSWKQEGWLGSLQTAAEIGGRFVSAAGAPLPAPGLAQHAPPERTAPNRTAPPYGTAPPRSHRTARPGPARPRRLTVVLVEAGVQQPVAVRVGRQQVHGSRQIASSRGTLNHGGTRPPQPRRGSPPEPSRAVADRTAAASDTGRPQGEHRGHPPGGAGIAERASEPCCAALRPRGMAAGAPCCEGRRR